jgi:hypothetical protein
MAVDMADADASMPRNAQLLAILRQRDVPVDGVLERQELVGLVKRTGGIPASTSVPTVAPVLPAPALAPLPPLAAKRTLADVDADARPEEARRARVRVSVPRGHLHPFAAGFVRVVRFEVAHAIVASVLGGGFTAEARYEDLELVNVPGVGEACASEASEMHARSTYKKGDLVCIVGGPHVRHTGTHVVTLVKGDDQYDVHVAEHGGLVVPGNFLARSVQRFGQRPTVAMVPPATTPQGSAWTASQREVLRLVLEEHVNVQITGEPGAGKTEVASALMLTLQAAGVDFMLVSLSNMITSFLRKRHARNGLKDVENVIGTFSSKLWASLGSDFSFDRVEEMADEIMTAPYTKSVLQRIRKTQVLLIEEEQNTVPSFKDVLFAVISKVCGCNGPEPAGNKQIVTIGDERQLGGIPVQDGTPGQGTEGLRVGGALVPGGQPLQTLAFESQCLQAFYPEQPVFILGEHFATLGVRSEALPGTVVRFCLLRDKFLVRCKGAAEFGTRGFGSNAPVMVEYVAEAHLRAVTSRAANFASVHLLGSKRVRNGTYADELPAAQQTAEALWHRAITELHHGITDSGAVRELFARLQDVGRRLLVERPDVYEVTQFSFLTNQRLETFAKEHVHKYRPEEAWAILPDADVVHEHHAIKCDAGGEPWPAPGCTLWSGGASGDDSSGGRQFVSGAVACYLYWKKGYELVLGTLPQHVKPGTTPVKIPVGGNGKKELGFLKPGSRIVPVGEVEGATIAGRTYTDLLVECPEFPYDEEVQSYPTAYIPMLLYTSDVLHGSKLHWLQWPVKYRLLTTSHSNTGRGFQWLLMHFEHIWCYDAVFSTLTRAMEVPGPVGASLAARAGCAGIVVMNNARGDFFDCEKLALGLHPKTALRFKSKYAKDVPVARLQSAEAWVREHKAFHLQREAHELERLRARSGAARTAAPAAGGSTSSGGAAPVVGASSATIGRSTRFSTRDD